MTKDELQAKRAVALSELKNIEEALCLDEHYIDIIEKENAELKEELKDANEKVVYLACNQNKDLKYKLTKAKEFLNEFMRIGKASDEDFEHDYSELIRETEQFLNSENIILEDAQVGNSPFDADEVFNKEIKAYPEEK